ncbi:hypothetical protein PROFUN_02634 [Planoprotostelium fungivorum]|uniref:Integrase catalytic domain-containing protein n=1 Tax=Planoprotostelium fungivorum TaxID=1890364 RepID=A0A2P6NV95_9EUKA|nr:hypothetical protein PROFUN_02634 [Planoprotostelium fungivorum]
MHRGKRQKIGPNLTEYLLSIWLDPSTTSNSIEGLYRSASRHNIFKLEFTVDDIRSFLSHQSTYKRHLGFNLQYKQQKHTVVPGPLVKWQIDLADMQHSAEYNDGTNYLLTIIDVFSKYALAIPLQNKQGKTIARALDYIFRIKINNKAYKPIILLSDNGKEFIAKEVKQVCIIERFNKTIKQKIAQQRIAPSLTEYLLSIWLDPSTTSNSIEGLYRSASRHNIFKLEFTVDNIRSFLSHQSTYKRHLGFNLQYKQQKHTVVHRPMANGRWTLQTCRTLLICPGNFFAE